MASSDTIIGIVGTVVLLGVMVGVFVYEYNNVPEDLPQPYEALRNQDDLDGDGIPNSEEDDMDGDGIPDAQDDELATRSEWSGGLGPDAGLTANSVGQDIRVYNHSIGTNATITYTTQVPADLPGLTLRLEDSEGAVLATGTSSRTGTTVTVHLHYAEALPAGTYRYVVGQETGSMGGSFDAVAYVLYG